MLRRDSCSTCGGIASVLWRLFSTAEGSCSTAGGSISTCGGIASVLWRDSISTVEAVQYCGG